MWALNVSSCAAFTLLVLTEMWCLQEEMRWEDRGRRHDAGLGCPRTPTLDVRRITVCFQTMVGSRELKPQTHGGGPRTVKCIDTNCQIHFQKGRINTRATDKLQSSPPLSFWAVAIALDQVGSCFTSFYYLWGRFSRCLFTSGISLEKVECFYELDAYSGGWIWPFKRKSKI